METHDLRLRWLAILRPEEWLLVLFGGILLVLAQIGPGIAALPEILGRIVELSMGRRFGMFPRHLLFFLVLGAGWSAAVGVRERRAARGAAYFGALARAYLPFLACYVIYALLRALIPAVRPDTLDADFARMEIDWFGTLSSTAVYRALESKAAAILLSGCYATHLFAPPILAFALYAAGRRREFRDFLLAIAISAFVGFAGYILVPVVGPRYVAPDYQVLVDAQYRTFVVEFTDLWARATPDCFPSLHTAWGVLVLLGAWRFWKPLGAAFLPVAAGIPLACLYFGWHYLVDLPAGAFLAVAAWFGAREANAWWYRRVRDLAPEAGRGDPAP